MSHVTVTLPSSGTPVTVSVTLPPPTSEAGSAVMLTVGLALTILKVAVPMTVSPTLTVAVAVPTLVLALYLTEYSVSLITSPFLVTLTAGSRAEPV